MNFGARVSQPTVSQIKQVVHSNPQGIIESANNLYYSLYIGCLVNLGASRVTVYKLFELTNRSSNLIGGLK